MRLIPWRSKREGGGATDLLPSAPFQQFRDEEDGFPARFLGDPWWDVLSSWGSVEVSDGRKALKLKIALPGLDPAEIGVSLSGDLLTVQGNRCRTEEEEGEGYASLRRTTGFFTRTFRLPADVDPDGIRADYQHGVLSLRLKKARTPRARRIKIRRG